MSCFYCGDEVVQSSDRIVPLSLEDFVIFQEHKSRARYWLEDPEGYFDSIVSCVFLDPFIIVVIRRRTAPFP